MLPIEEPVETQGALASGDLLTGDLGLVALRGMLENGVGYIVSSWQERPTPIDAAIDDARRSVLPRHGVVLRRLRSLSALAPLVTRPDATWPASESTAVPRGLVIFAGRRGMRPALQSFVQLAVPGAVVGICFDADAARMHDAIVIDPEPTAAGLVLAFDQAFAASARTGHPALVLVRDRMLGMRGTIRCRADLAPRDAAERDAGMPRPMPLATAVATCGINTAELGPGPTATQSVIVAAGSLAGAARRALALIDASLDAAGCTPLGAGTALVSLAAAGVLPSAEPVLDLFARAPRLLLLDRPGHALEAPIAALAPATDCMRRSIDAESARGEDVAAAIAAWLLSDASLSEATRAVLEAVADRAVARDDAARRRAVRVPRRDERLHRTVSPTVAAGLALAQGVIGVPARLAAEYPTYQADTGVPLTVVPSTVFVEHGAASAAPNTPAGVFVVTGASGGVAEQAATIGATVELVDGSSPRAIGRAIALACGGPRTAPHVIVVGEVQRIAAPSATRLGIDPELLGTERLATAAVPAAGSVLVDLDDELLAGPVEILLDTAETRAALEPVRELTPATWEIAVQQRAGGSRMGDAAWNLRRRMVQAVSGVDL